MTNARDLIDYHQLTQAAVINTGGQIRHEKTAAFTIGQHDRAKLIEVTSGTFTIGLELASKLRSGFWVDVYNSGSGTVTLDPTGPELIDGAATLAIAAGGHKHVVCTGTAFETVALATSAELAAHLADTSDAHDASAISVDSTTLTGTGTDVQAVLEELDNLLDAHGAAQHTNITRPLWIPAQEFIVESGSPDLAPRNTDRYVAWAFDTALDERVIAAITVPKDWVSGWTINMYWSNLGAGSGDVSIEIGAAATADGASLASAAATNDIFTAPAQHVLKISTSTEAASGTLAVDKHVVIRVGRVGASDPVSDTLANDMAFIGVRIDYTANQ